MKHPLFNFRDYIFSIELKNGSIETLNEKNARELAARINAKLFVVYSNGYKQNLEVFT